MTQKEAVLQHLKEKGFITSWEAIQLYGCTRLSDCIFKLRNEGYNIETKYITKENRLGNISTFCKYELEEKGEKENDQIKK